AGGFVRPRPVSPALALDVAPGHRPRRDPRAEILRWLEGPIAVAQEHRHGVGNLGSNRQVLDAIAIEVADSDPRGTGTHPECPRWLEGPIALAQQDRNSGTSLGAGTIVSHHH